MNRPFAIGAAHRRWAPAFAGRRGLNSSLIWEWNKPSLHSTRTDTRMGSAIVAIVAIASARIRMRLRLRARIRRNLFEFRPTQLLHKTHNSSGLNGRLVDSRLCAKTHLSPHKTGIFLKSCFRKIRKNQSSALKSGASGTLLLANIFVQDSPEMLKPRGTLP